MVILYKTSGSCVLIRKPDVSDETRDHGVDLPLEATTGLTAAGGMLA